MTVTLLDEHHDEIIPRKRTREDYSDKINVTTAPLAEITSIQFGLLSPDEMRKIAVDVITRPSISKGIPTLHTISSPLLGPTDKSTFAKCCGLQKCSCDGNFGLFELAYPIYNILFLDRIIKILNCICPWCARLLLSKENHKFNQIRHETNPKQRLHTLLDICEKIVYCSVDNKRRKSRKVANKSIDNVSIHSMEMDGDEDAAQLLVNQLEDPHQKEIDQSKQILIEQEKAQYEARLIETGCCGGIQFKYVKKRCDIWRIAKDTTLDGQFQREKKYQVSQAMVLDILSRMSDEDINWVGCHPIYARPENMLIQVMPIPPANNRPVMGFNNGTKKQRTENAYTRKLHDQVLLNLELKKKRCELIHAMRREEMKASLSISSNQAITNDSSSLTNPVNNVTTSLEYSPNELIQDREQNEQDNKLNMLINSEEGTNKTKSTLTAVLRAEKAQKKALFLKEENRCQLELQNGRLKMGQAYRSGDPTIDDLEWSNFLKHDAAFFDVTYDLISELQSAIGSYIKEDTPAHKRSANKKPFLRPVNNKQSLNSRVKGKTQLVRGNLNAKRTEFSARGVIIPDAEINIDELGTPLSTAKQITLPEVVSHLNIEHLRRLVRNGPKEYPGANFVSINVLDLDEGQEEGVDGHVKHNQMIDLQYEDRIQFSDLLQVGMIVHRHLVVGDLFPFNRQPSLHKFSFMGHRIVIIPGFCFKMNPAACKCYHADFDGDAMVLHIPQTLGARIETRRLLHITLQFLTPQSSTPLITPIQDTVMGCFQLTGDDIIMSDKDFYKYIGASHYIPISRLGISTPFMFIKKANQKIWKAYRSGKQLFSQLLPFGVDYSRHQRYFKRYPSSSTINQEGNKIIFKSLMSEIQEWYYQPSHQQDPTILNQQMVRGLITSKVIGSSPNGLIHQILHQYGNETCSRFESDLTVVVNNWLADFGFSQGPDDCILPDNQTIRTLIKNGLDTLNNHPLLKINENHQITVIDEEEKENQDMEIETFDVMDQKKTQELQLTRLREKTIQDLLNQFVNFVGTQAHKQIEGWNRLWQMVVSGAKGKMFNLTQILALLGQTELGGERLQFEGRITSHFALPGWLDHIKNPKILSLIPQDNLLSKGFITSCFASGLSPIEFYAHSIGSREGLINSSSNTSEAGYTGRRLMQAMSSLMIHNDLSVKDPNGNILQLLYGKDGFDATWLCPIDFDLIELNDKQIMDQYNSVPILDSILWDLELQSVGKNYKLTLKDKNIVKNLLIEEVNIIKRYRNKLRTTRLHYGCTKINTQMSVPVNVTLVIREALRYQHQNRFKDNEDEIILTPTMLIRMTHACMERLYSYYPGVWYRLWEFEALFYTCFSCRNVFLNYGLNYLGLEFALAEVEGRFQHSLAHAMELVGPLAAQMVGELYTQNMLNQHRIAGSSDAAGGEGVNIGVFQECMNLTQKPKNPQMRIYTISIEACLEFMSWQDIEQVIFKNQSHLTLSSSEQQHFLAIFVAEQLLNHTLQSVCLSSPRVIQEINILETHYPADQEWLPDLISLFHESEKTILSQHRSPYVMRFVIDAQKLSDLQLSCEDVIISIRKLLKETISSLMTKEEHENHLLDNSLLNEQNRNDLFAMWSPIMVSQGRSYRVLRLYISTKVKYYHKLLEKAQGNIFRLMNTLIAYLAQNTHLSGVVGIRGTGIEKETNQIHDPITGGLIAQSEYIILTNGSNVMDSFSSPFIDERRSHTSCLIETNEVWGIIAGANRLYRALFKVLEANGSNIDKRHLQQVTKTMCHRGFYMPFRRQSMSAANDYSLLHLVSFEQVMETFADACSSGDVDLLKGPTENALIGKICPVGTGGVQVELPTADDPIIQPTPDVIASHIEMVRRQVLPIFTNLDVRIMLENSGEERVYQNTEEQLKHTSSNMIEQTVALQHKIESKKRRATTLELPPPNIVVEATQQQLNPLLINQNENHMDTFWQTIEMKRRTARLALKEKLALNIARSDHDIVKRKLPKQPKEKKRKEIDEQVLQDEPKMNTEQKLHWMVEKTSLLNTKQKKLKHFHLSLFQSQMPIIFTVG